MFIKPIEIKDIKKVFETSMFCKIKTAENTEITLCLMYRSPNSSDDENNSLNKQIVKKYFAKILIFENADVPQISINIRLANSILQEFQDRCTAMWLFEYPVVVSNIDTNKPVVIHLLT